MPGVRRYTKKWKQSYNLYACFHSGSSPTGEQGRRAPTGFVPGGHRRRKGSVVGGTMASEEPPWSWKHFGHWMSNGASKFSPFPKMHLYFYYSRCNSNDMGKNLCRNPGGSGDPLAPSWGRPWRRPSNNNHACCRGIMKAIHHPSEKKRNNDINAAFSEQFRLFGKKPGCQHTAKIRPTRGILSKRKTNYSVHSSQYCL